MKYVGQCFYCRGIYGGFHIKAFLYEGWAGEVISKWRSLGEALNWINKISSNKIPVRDSICWEVEKGAQIQNDVTTPDLRSKD